MTMVAFSGDLSRLTPEATMRSASMSSPESVSSRMARRGWRAAIWKISARFFSPPENPSLRLRERNWGSSSTRAAFSRMNFNSSPGGISGSPRLLRFSLMAVLMKLFTLTPGISTGYWNERNMPRWARSSGERPSRSSPRKVMLPAVFSNLGLPAITAERVDLPEPFGPMMACTSPLGISRLMPLRISVPCTLACKFLMTKLMM